MARKKTSSKSTQNSQLHNIKDIIKIEERDRIAMSISDRIANSITSFSGSMIYVGIHVVWFAVWIVFNLGWIPGLKPFDPFPFSLLTMIVSLEAIFLSAFVLISQNKQALQADKRAKVDLQVNMLGEQERTQLIAMISEIQQHLGIRTKDGAMVKAMKKKTNVNTLAHSIDKAEEKKEKGKPQRPQSAVDTSK